MTYGADPNTEDNKNTSAFNSLIKQNTDASKVVLDNFIATNDKEMDSSDLLLVYNLNFFKEGKHEMSKHAAMVECNSKLLFHPLVETMTTLKWNCRSKVFIGFNILKVLFAVSLTWLIIGKLGWNAMQLAKRSMTFVSNGNTSHKGELFCQHSTSFDENVTGQDDITLRAVYCIVALCVLLLCFGELGQMLENITEYLSGFKNWMDMMMIVSTIGYLSVDVGCFFPISMVNVTPTREAAAISIFFAWFNLVLLLGNISSVAKYIHMFINVSKTLMFFMLVYSPALVAFALSFYVLLLPNGVESFDNPFKSILKTLAMLVGELEYDGTFINIKGKSEETKSSLKLAQMISVLFLCSVSIVIMNLLVGLTVSRMDELEAEARQVIMKSRVSKLIRLQKFWYNQGENQRSPSTISCFCNFCRNLCKRYDGKFTVFSTLRRTRERNHEKTLDNYARVCVQPNQTSNEKQEDSYFIRARNMLPITHDYKVYLYDDWKYEAGSDTGFTFPKELVDNTLDRLMSKDALREELST